MCECVEWKIAYLKRAFPAVGAIFTDLQDLGKGQAHDAVSGHVVKVPVDACICQCVHDCRLFLVDCSAIVIVLAQVEGLACGYPCRSISAQNPDPKSFLDKKSTTGSGFRGLMNYLDSAPGVRFVLLENVRQMMQTRHQFKGEVPTKIQSTWFQERGFVELFSFLVNSSEYGLAQSRTRAWALYVRKDFLRQLCFAILLTMVLIERVFSMIFDGCKLQCWRCRPGLAAEPLMRAMCSPTIKLDYFLSDGDELRKDKCSKPSGEKWKEKFQEMCELLGMASW